MSVPGPDGVAPAVDIVIVNWNSGEQLRDCIASIMLYGDRAVQQVIVVDNGSIDGSANVQNDQLRLLVLQAGQNLGFAAACNLGARQGDAPYLLFLNPDACLRPGTLSAVLAYMRS